MLDHFNIIWLLLCFVLLKGHDPIHVSKESVKMCLNKSHSLKVPF